MKYTLTNMTLNNTTLACYNQSSFPKSFIFKPHYHPRAEIMYVESGEMEVTVFLQDKPHKELLTQNQYILLDNDVPHAFICKEETVLFTLEFIIDENRTNAFAPAFSMQNLFSDCPALISEIKKNGYAVYRDNCSLKKALSRLTAVFSELKELSAAKFRFPEKEYLFPVYLQEVMVLLCLNASIRRPNGIQYIGKINVYLQKYFANDFSLDFLSEAVGINKYYMERLYKQHTGKSIHQELIALRAKSAEELLMSTDLSVEKIAIKTGFKTRQQLIYNFKKLYGMPPSEYVARNRHIFKEFPPDEFIRTHTYDFHYPPHREH